MTSVCLTPVLCCDGLQAVVKVGVKETWSLCEKLKHLVPFPGECSVCDLSLLAYLLYV